MPTAADSKFVQLDGLKFHYLDWGGGGPPLLMLHGFTGHAHTWDHTAAALSDRYRVFALDQRGHGDSEWADVYGTRAMVDDVLRFLDAMGLAAIDLMGLSMGGIVSFEFAAAHPERVKRLVVLDIGPEIDPAGMKRITESMSDRDVFASEDEAVEQARAANPRPTDDAIRHRVAHNLKALPDGKLTYKWDKALRDGTAQPIDPSTEERWAAWRAVGCPTLLVRGDDSDILSLETTERMLAENPNATLRVVADCGHSITLDRPEAFVEVVAPWLS
jgi:pimeloyl-ACP methyl ester carboxylesterase